jgi:hypothetical protein
VARFVVILDDVDGAAFSWVPFDDRQGGVWAKVPDRFRSVVKIIVPGFALLSPSKISSFRPRAELRDILLVQNLITAPIVDETNFPGFGPHLVVFPRRGGISFSDFSYANSSGVRAQRLECGRRQL